MSQENVDLMRRVLEAFNSGDPDTVAEFAHPEGQMEENNSVFPGLDRVYVGPEGFRQWYKTVVVEAWEDFSVDVEELRALDHEQVLVRGVCGRGAVKAASKSTCRPFKSSASRMDW